MGLFVVFRRKIIVIQALSLLCSGPFGPVFRPGGRPTRGLGPFRACKRRHPEHVVRKERREYLRLRPCLADCPHEQFVVSLDPAEHVLYAASCARLPCVAFYLERGERFFRGSPSCRRARGSLPATGRNCLRSRCLPTRPCSYSCRHPAVVRRRCCHGRWLP